MMEKEPEIVYIRKDDQTDFDRLREKDSPFSNYENKEVFLAAMATGFTERRKVEMKSNERAGGGFFRTSYLNDREKCLIKAIAVATIGDINILLDKKAVYSIAEGYAAGGVKALKEYVTGASYGSYANRLEVEILEIFEDGKRDGQ